MTVAVVVVMFIIFVAYSVFEPPVNGAKSPTKMTIYNMGQMQLALELYFDAHRSYPSVSQSCVSVDSVRTQLIAEAFLPVTPDVQEPSLFDRLQGNTNQGYPIKMSVSPDALHYVLESEGGGFKDITVLDTDIDGQVLGCNCDDPNYCVGS